MLLNLRKLILSENRLYGELRKLLSSLDMRSFYRLPERSQSIFVASMLLSWLSFLLIVDLYLVIISQIISDHIKRCDASIIITATAIYFDVAN